MTQEAPSVGARADEGRLGGPLWSPGGGGQGPITMPDFVTGATHQVSGGSFAALRMTEGLKDDRVPTLDSLTGGMAHLTMMNKIIGIGIRLCTNSDLQISARACIKPRLLNGLSKKVTVPNSIKPLRKWRRTRRWLNFRRPWLDV